VTPANLSSPYRDLTPAGGCARHVPRGEMERCEREDSVNIGQTNSTGNLGLDAFADAVAARIAARLNAGQQPRLLSVKDAAAYIGRTPKALRHMIADGAVPTVREGGRIHLDRTDLDRWIEMRRTAA